MARRSGCSFPILLVVFVAVALSYGGREKGPNADVRRPPVEEAPVGVGGGLMPRPDVAPEYGIEDPGPPKDSQGTAFAISPNGLWLTAEHVVKGCDRIGLALNPDQAEAVGRVFASTQSDAALIADGLRSSTALALTAELPREGDDGYHMGFPTGRPAVVHSRFIGVANAMRGRGGPTQPILAWAEVDRNPPFDHTLGGISGGPTLDMRGRVVGINSASSDRRGRVLTTHPLQAIELVRSTRAVPQSSAAGTIPNPDAAAARFEALYRAGAIRQVFCDVIE